MSIKSAAILGGGTAGWLTALFLKRYWPELTITVIEDPKKPPIIAGESGGHPMDRVYEQLGIDIVDWAKEVNATPKQGGIFYNWNGKGHVFYHALFSKYYHKWQERFPSKAERYFYFRSLIGSNIEPCEIPYSGKCVKNNLVPFDKNLNLIGPTMWHFDSRANAAYLKKIAFSRGITLVEGEFQYPKTNDNGDIISLVLDNNQEVNCDWVFDCSGFARLLLEKFYKSRKKDYSQYFPARAVIAWWDNPIPSSATIATAMDAGWSWKINLKHRSGQGYLYDPDILSKDSALDEIKSKFGNHVEPVAAIQFTPEILERVQQNNVIGIGLSTGFLEPLEANGVGIIIDSLEHLKAMWDPFKSVDEFPEGYNRLILESYDSITDFLTLHYRGSGLGTEFWKSQQNDSYRKPLSLLNRIKEIEYFLETGKIDLEKFDRQYSLESWLTVGIALGVIDTTKVPRDETSDFVLQYYIEEKKLHENIFKEYIGIEEWYRKF
jgi:tryptophan halogenase